MGAAVVEVPASHVAMVSHRSRSPGSCRPPWRLAPGTPENGRRRQRRSLKQPTDLSSMQRTSFERMNCSVAQCLEVVGEWWSAPIVRDAFLGRAGSTTSKLASESLQHPQPNGAGISSTMVSSSASPDQDNPPRSEYRLTGMGRDLWPVVSHSMGTRSPPKRGQAPAKATLTARGSPTSRVLKTELVPHMGRNGPASRPQAST